LGDIWNNECFQQFLKEEVYQSKDIENSLGWKVKFQDEDGSEYELEEINLIEDLDATMIEFYLTDDYTEYEIVDWKKDKNLKLRVMFDASLNPNNEAEEILLDYFKKEEGIMAAKNDANVSVYYSDFAANDIAFNIKVHADFIHETLYELKYFDEEDEWSNRMEAISSFVDEIAEEMDVNDQWTDGKNGGYLILELGCLTKENIQYVSRKIDEKEAEYVKKYQDLSTYRYRFDHILEFLEEEKEQAIDDDDKVKLEKIENLIQEIDELEKEHAS